MPSTLLTAFYVAILSLSAAPALHAQPAKCKDVEFSQDVLERFPKAREACLDVVTRDGEQYAVFKADLLRVAGRTVRIRTKLPDGSHGAAQNITIAPNRRVLADGKPIAPEELAVGQELTAYVKVTEPVIAVATADTEPLTTQPLEAAPAHVAAAPEMPRTASPLPLIGAGGLLLLAIGAAIRLATQAARS
ncbi:MAG TPA: hypothetical protein VHK24_12425 [Steroidobacter sp.]|jgi:hypothetical protein|nr:hypothetical protein [Steroidobacter sp.]